MNQATAEVLVSEGVECHEGDARHPFASRATVIYTDNPRAYVAEKFVELAGKLARKELDGIRCEWADIEGMPGMVTVESGCVIDGKRTIVLTRSTFAHPSERMRVVSEGTV